MIEEICLAFVGQSVEAVGRLVAQCVERRMRYAIRADAMACIDRHRREGDAIVLLTSTSRLVANPLGRLIAADAVVALFQNVRDGRFVDGLETPACYAEGKTTCAKSFARERGESLSQATYYTDSHVDLPTLLAVGHPVPVNPDKALRREARRREWATLRWSNAPWASSPERCG